MSTCENFEKCDAQKKGKLKRKVQALCTKLWRKSQFKKLTQKVTVNNLICQLKPHLPIQIIKSPLHSQLADINYYPDDSMERFAEQWILRLVIYMNQDCLENLVSILRSKSGFRDNPDP